MQDITAEITVIGAGQMGQIYINNLLEMGIPSENIYCCDINPEKVDAARNKFPGVVVEQELSLLPTNDVAIIASSSPSHASVIEVLAARGTRYFFCEKPLGMTLQETEQIRKAVEVVDGQVYTAFLINFSPAVAEILALMNEENLVMVEGDVIWCKNRIGDTRPSPGDTEDESVHGAELLRMLAGINRRIYTESVSGRVSYLKFVDQEAQERAHRLDPSFPLEVDSATRAIISMDTDVGSVHASLCSSFTAGRQKREVNIILAHKDQPWLPLLSACLNFDVKGEGGIVDLFQFSDLQNRKNSREHAIPANKIADQIRAFFHVINGGEEDVRLTPFHRAQDAVKFTKAVQSSHNDGGRPVLLRG
jgi:predicted dehydrogenase